MERRSGFLIAFEGIDGCGKSTQAELLCNRLKEAGIQHTLVREPGSTPVAEAVRSVLLHATQYQLVPETELLLYLAARADLYRRQVLPDLEKGLVVVSDRCFWSSVAYQGAGLGIGVEQTRKLCLFAVAGREPDLVILLDIPLAEAAKRHTGAPDRIESRSEDYLLRVREAFLTQAAGAAETTLLLDGTRPPQEIGEAVWQRVRELLKLPAQRKPQ